MKKYHAVRVFDITHKIALVQLQKINKQRKKDKMPELGIIDVYHAAMLNFDPKVMK